MVSLPIRLMSELHLHQHCCLETIHWLRGFGRTHYSVSCWKTHFLSCRLHVFLQDSSYFTLYLSKPSSTCRRGLSLQQDAATRLVCLSCCAVLGLDQTCRLVLQWNVWSPGTTEPSSGQFREIFLNLLSLCHSGKLWLKHVQTLSEVTGVLVVSLTSTLHLVGVDRFLIPSFPNNGFNYST